MREGKQAKKKARGREVKAGGTLDGAVQKWS